MRARQMRTRAGPRTMKERLMVVSTMASPLKKAPYCGSSRKICSKMDCMLKPPKGKGPPPFGERVDEGMRGKGGWRAYVRAAACAGSSRRPTAVAARADRLVPPRLLLTLLPTCARPFPPAVAHREAAKALARAATGRAALRLHPLHAFSALRRMRDGGQWPKRQPLAAGAAWWLGPPTLQGARRSSRMLPGRCWRAAAGSAEAQPGLALFRRLVPRSRAAPAPARRAAAASPGPVGSRRLWKPPGTSWPPRHRPKVNDSTRRHSKASVRALGVLRRRRRRNRQLHAPAMHSSPPLPWLPGALPGESPVDPVPRPARGAPCWCRGGTFSRACSKPS
jgi:hypothetical protein